MMHKPPQPELLLFDNVTVIDDSRFGTKLRMAMGMVSNSKCQTFNFASSPFGASPLAMAEACRRLERRLNLFYPYVPLESHTPQMLAAKEMGARIHIVPSDDFAFVSGTAQNTGGKFISFDSDEAIQIVANTAKSLGLNPDHVWAAGGLGGITRGLQLAWQNSVHHAVAVIHLPQANYGTAQVTYTETPFNEPCRTEPPFDCNPYFEAKAWEVMQQHRLGQENVVFWNPAVK